MERALVAYIIIVYVFTVLEFLSTFNFLWITLRKYVVYLISHGNGLGKAKMLYVSLIMVEHVLR